MTASASSSPFDVVIIGSGPAGYVAAIRAGQLGLRTALVERDSKLGGTCLHRGCIPTKALLHTADLLEEARNAATFGVVIGDVKLDFPAAQKYKSQTVTKLSKGIEFLMKKNKVETVLGSGKLAGRKGDLWNVGVSGKDGQNRTLETRHVVLATGSVPRDLPFAKADGQRVINSDHILELSQVPKSLVVLGAGAVGVEFASIYKRFGTEVTILELLPRLLPIEDEEVSAELLRAFNKQKIKSICDAKMEGVDKSADGVVITYSKGGKQEKLAAEQLLVAVGRRPVIEGVGIEGTKVKVEKGAVVVDGFMRTGEPGVYAIGDLVPTPQLAHVGSMEGILAVEHIAVQLGKYKPETELSPINYDHTPSCTYCAPEVASIGLTEAKAKERGYQVKTGKMPFAAVSKAKILDETEGFVKIVSDSKYDEILGVHIIGPKATELIAEAGMALRLESTTEEMLRTMHAHPTLSEAMGEAAHAAHSGSPLHA
jgi:dihydrolipoamide dehydrogenase